MNQRGNILITILLALLGCGQGFAMPSYVDSIFYARYTYVRVLDADEPVPQLSDEEFFDRSASIIFPVAKTNLPSISESPLLTELERDIIPHFNSDTLRLVRIDIRGAASPEGRWAFNQKLGQQRTEALLRFFAQRMMVGNNRAYKTDGANNANSGYGSNNANAISAMSVGVGFPDAANTAAATDDSSATLLASRSLVEDYPTLCLLMRRAGDPDYTLVRDLTDRYLATDPATLKRRLQAERGGALWQHLLRTYFPDLRAARFVLYLQKIPKALRPDAGTTVSAADGFPVSTPTIPRPDTLLPRITVAPLTIASTPDTLRARREFLSVKTNLPFYAIYMPSGYNRWCPIPNVAVEFYPLHGHFTYGFSFDMPWWQHYHQYKFFQIRNYQFEARYYLHSGDISRRRPGEGAAFRGLFFSAYAHTGRFGICFDADRGWVGEGGGAGIGVGYVLQLSRPSRRGQTPAYGHWRLEFAAQVGYMRCRYDPYKYENPINPAYHDDLYYYKWTGKPEDFKLRQYRFSWFGPTRIAINLTYDLLYRRQAKKGVSFKNHETDRRR